jgi:cytochrome c oxidase subunit 3
VSTVLDPESDLAARERNLNSLATVTMTVVLAGVTMTFGAMIAVFMLRALKDEFWSHIRLPHILWLSTALLLASSVFLERARGKMRQGNWEAFHRTIFWAIVLGVLFLVSQVTAWWEILRSGISMANNPHSWFIFLFSGLHGLHIVAGLAGLGYVYYRTREQASGPRYQMETRAATRAVGIFWHYMDGMWVLLFALLVLWRS